MDPMGFHHLVRPRPLPLETRTVTTERPSVEKTERKSWADMCLGFLRSTVAIWSSRGDQLPMFSPTNSSTHFS